MVKDKLFVSFVFYVLYTCSKNDAVVNTAAIIPKTSIRSMFLTLQFLDTIF